MRQRPTIDHLRGPAASGRLVIVAPGGMADSLNASSGWGPGALRMLPLVEVAARAAPDAAVGVLRYRLRGWNGESRDAAVDLQSALADLPARVQQVLLIGHSMGGRAVVAAVGDPRVTGVCALAPWLPLGEPLGDVLGEIGADAGRGAGPPRLVFVHGSRDTWTDPAATADYVRRCREQGWPAAFFVVPGEGHGLLREPRALNDLVHRFVVSAWTGAADALLDGAVSVDPAKTPTVLGTRRPRSALRGLASVGAASARLLGGRRLRPGRPGAGRGAAMEDPRMTGTRQ